MKFKVLNSYKFYYELWHFTSNLPSLTLSVTELLTYSSWKDLSTLAQLQKIDDLFQIQLQSKRGLN